MGNCLEKHKNAEIKEIQVPEKIARGFPKALCKPDSNWSDLEFETWKLEGDRRARVWNDICTQEREYRSRGSHFCVLDWRDEEVTFDSQTGDFRCSWVHENRKFNAYERTARGVK